MFITRRFPFGDIERMLDQFNQVFDTFGGPLGLRSVPSGAFPALSLYDAKDKLVLTAEIPGVDPAKLELDVQENSLTLAGKRESEKHDDKKNFYRQERPFGEFRRTITLGEKVDPSRVAATCKHGILRVEMPKLQAARAQTIQIKAE